MICLKLNKAEVKNFSSLNDYVLNRYKSLCTKMKKNIELSLLLKQMPYHLFLETDYWNTISGYKKYVSKFTCSKCKSKKRLQVHHTTYEHLGFEYCNMNDLIVLCDKCHKKEHKRLKLKK